MALPIFSITDLHCGYRPHQVVLEVDHLEIPRGKLIFVVGVSGGGKSTLIETLGLMNQTTHHAGLGGKVVYHPAEEKPIDLLGLWPSGDQALSRFRQDHFSFIFQQTNLMPNFSAGENMLITALFAGQDTQAAEVQVRQLMERIDLPERAFEAAIQELSGGQRQRLAFIRALVADYEVLFGDEPTGNLDNATAKECFHLLRDEVHEAGKTAIIVSHDLPIATEFGDQVIPISLHEIRGNKFQGRINAKRMLFRRPNGGMQSSDGDLIADPTSYLEENIFNVSG